MIESPRRRRFLPAVRIRPVEPGDSAALGAFYAGLSPDSRYRRLMSMGARINEGDANRFCRADHAGREGFVAVVESTVDGPTIVGHLCLEPAGPGSVEMAVAVADRFQGRGIGRTLTHAALDWAEHHGIARLRASMLVDNAGIIRLIQSLHRPVTFSPPVDGVVEAIVQVSAGPARAA
jgi:GNAT superfamily N-acetyltransferase